jgi:cold shock protein
MKMPTGAVKWFNNEKGYGIIARDDGAGDLFLHYSAIMVTGFKAMQEDERVSFEVSQGQKGPQAERVRSLERHEDPQASYPQRPRGAAWGPVGRLAPCRTRAKRYGRGHGPLASRSGRRN